MRGARRRGIFIALALAALLGIHSLSAQEAGQTAPPKRAVLLIPGFRGSDLWDEASGKQVWVRPGNLLGTSPNLALESEALGLGQGSAMIRSRAVLDYIPILPIFYGLDPYRAFLESLRDSLQGKAEVIGFAYDWRQDNIATVRILDGEVKRLRQQGYGRIDVIAHSMGGLTLAYYLRYGTQDPQNARETWEGLREIHSAIFAAVPFEGTVASIGFLQKGSKVLWNHTLLNSDVMGSFPSTYQLLPFNSESAFFEQPPGGEPVPLNLFDVVVWRKYGIGLLRSQLGIAGEMLAARGLHVERALAQARALGERLHAPVHSAPPRQLPALNIFSNCCDTPNKKYLLRSLTGEAMFVDQQGIGATAFVPGDQLITVDSAQLPDAYQKSFTVQALTTDHWHGQVFNDKAVRREILAFLQ